jgi:hypothetical protein
MEQFEEVENPIQNNFHYCNFFQISTEFELFRRFWFKAELTKLWSHRLIATLIANAPELHFGQEVLHGDLICLHYDMEDMHKLNPQIEEDMEFRRWLNAKEFLEIFPCLDHVVTFSCISTLETISC